MSDIMPETATLTEFPVFSVTANDGSVLNVKRIGDPRFDGRVGHRINDYMIAGLVFPAVLAEKLYQALGNELYG